MLKYSNVGPKRAFISLLDSLNKLNILPTEKLAGPTGVSSIKERPIPCFKVENLIDSGSTHTAPKSYLNPKYVSIVKIESSFGSCCLKSKELLKSWRPTSSFSL